MRNELFHGRPLQSIARELVVAVRKNVTIDWTLRENVRAQRVSGRYVIRKRTVAGTHGSDGNAPITDLLAGADLPSGRIIRLAGDYAGLPCSDARWTV